MVPMPLAQLSKSTACMPSMLISRTRLMGPSLKLFSCAIAVLITQAAVNESKVSVFFIFILIVTSITDGMESHVTPVLRRLKLFVNSTDFARLAENHHFG